MHQRPPLELTQLLLLLQKSLLLLLVVLLVLLLVLLLPRRFLLLLLLLVLLVLLLTAYLYLLLLRLLMFCPLLLLLASAMLLLNAAVSAAGGGLYALVATCLWQAVDIAHWLQIDLKVPAQERAAAGLESSCIQAIPLVRIKKILWPHAPLNPLMVKTVQQTDPTSQLTRALWLCFKPNLHTLSRF
jgi:hypothetical protein